MPNVKPGDLAITVDITSLPENNGIIVRVGAGENHPVHGLVWRTCSQTRPFQRALRGPCMEMSTADYCLRRLVDGDLKLDEETSEDLPREAACKTPSTTSA